MSQELHFNFEHQLHNGTWGDLCSGLTSYTGPVSFSFSARPVDLDVDGAWLMFIKHLNVTSVHLDSRIALCESDIDVLVALKRKNPQMQITGDSALVTDVTIKAKQPPKSKGKGEQPPVKVEEDLKVAR
jgi:hypothetical protein